ncbi:hypothetical protein ACI8AC_09900 [Geodermatophilus sp. SYSU D00758]
MPVLSRGRHRNPARGACFMEYTALLAGEPFSDAPDCVDGELAAVLRHANDRLSAADRPRLVPLLGRAIGLVVPPPVAAGPPRRPRRARQAVPAGAGPVVARLRRTVSRRLTAALGLQPSPSEWARYASGRDVDRLFWALMSEPWPVRTSAAYVDRLVDRLVLLHECYEQAVEELGLPAGRRPAVPSAAGAAPVP